MKKFKEDGRLNSYLNETSFDWHCIEAKDWLENSDMFRLNDFFSRRKRIIILHCGDKNGWFGEMLPENISNHLTLTTTKTYLILTIAKTSHQNNLKNSFRRNYFLLYLRADYFNRELASLRNVSKMSRFSIIKSDVHSSLFGIQYSNL